MTHPLETLGEWRNNHPIYRRVKPTIQQPTKLRVINHASELPTQQSTFSSLHTFVVCCLLYFLTWT